MKSYKSLPYNKTLIPLAKKLRKAGVLAEVLLWNEIKNKKFYNLDFDRQKIIGNYIVDFYCAELNLVIEIDGGLHELKQKDDAKRDAFLSSLGLRILRVLDFDVKKDMHQILSLIKAQIDHPVACSDTPPQRGILKGMD